MSALSEDLPFEVEKEETALDHFTELRRILLWSAFFFAIMFVTFLVFMPKVLPLLANGYKIVLMGPLDVIRFYTGVSGALALGLTTPFLGYQIWRFVKPGLTPTESKVTLTYVPAITASFLTGIAFGYFIVFPVLFKFLMNLGEKSFDVLITAREYFLFLLTSTLSLGFLFELPIVMVFLTSVGMLTPVKLKQVRKYAYILLAVISALITPPDFISQILVLTPLMALYELGILLSVVSFKKRQKRVEPAVT
ncbi:twin-arginine translocase subunit TatC [Heyndrickxia vini]|uniref:Sec-independent protein translocase protein TatC n=1 Tax=Heyndrickxia vini TaxID=1476025 RepID=A0ABX7E6P4_9BACI|nr:twin-arginine translocase subunit TatC [Heyndrickxia vini]QQZ10467.1 twin-arginine translocase subunit TatC [Heyndrickxia vini]